MTTVEIDRTKLKAAYDGLTSLVSQVKGQATRASGNTPVGLPSLSGAEFTGLMSWFEDQKPELKTRLDLAILLDTKGTGQVKYEVGTDDLESTKKLLGEKLATGLDDLNIKNPEDRKRATDLANMLLAYQNDKTVSATVLQRLGPEGLTSVVIQLRDLTDSHYSSYVNVFHEDADAARNLQDLMGKGLSTMLATASGTLGKDWAKKFGEGDPYTSAVLLNYADRQGRKFDGAFWEGVGLGLKKRQTDYPAPWGMNQDPNNWHFGSMHLDHPPNPMTEFLRGSDNSTDMAQHVFANKELREYFLSGEVPEVGKGHQLGNILRVATVDAALSENDAHAKKAAEISSETLWLLGGDKKPLEGIKEEVGGIVAIYIADADRVHDEAGDGKAGIHQWEPNGPKLGYGLGDTGLPKYGLNLNQAILRNVLEDVGDNDAAKSAVGKAVTLLNQARFDHGAEHGQAGLVQAGDESSSLVGFTTDAFVNGNIDHERDAAKERQKVAQFFTAPLDLIKTDKVPVLGSLILGETKDAIINGFTADQTSAAAKQGNDDKLSSTGLVKLQALYSMETHGMPTDSGWPTGSNGRPVSPDQLTPDQRSKILTDADAGSGTYREVKNQIETSWGKNIKQYGDN